MRLIIAHRILLFSSLSVLIIAVPVIPPDELTEAELTEIFGVENVKDIPDYEVIAIQRKTIDNQLHLSFNASTYTYELEMMVNPYFYHEARLDKIVEDGDGKHLRFNDSEGGRVCLYFGRAVSHDFPSAIYDCDRFWAEIFCKSGSLVIQAIPDRFRINDTHQHILYAIDDCAPTPPIIKNANSDHTRNMNSQGRKSSLQVLEVAGSRWNDGSTQDFGRSAGRKNRQIPHEANVTGNQQGAGPLQVPASNNTERIRFQAIPVGTISPSHFIQILPNLDRNVHFNRPEPQKLPNMKLVLNFFPPQASNLIQMSILVGGQPFYPILPLENETKESFSLQSPVDQRVIGIPFPFSFQPPIDRRPIEIPLQPQPPTLHQNIPFSKILGQPSPSFSIASIAQMLPPINPVVSTQAHYFPCEAASMWKQSFNGFSAFDSIECGNICLWIYPYHVHKVTSLPNGATCGKDKYCHEEKCVRTTKPVEHSRNASNSHANLTQWSEWGPWSQCSATCSCHNGTQFRTRTCEQDSNEACVGAAKEVREWESLQTPSHPTSTVEPHQFSHPPMGNNQSTLAKERTRSTAWEPWQACTISCGSGGVQMRRRNCPAVNRPCKKQQTRKCKDVPLECPEESRGVSA